MSTFNGKDFNLKTGKYVDTGIYVIDSAIENTEKIIEIAKSMPDMWSRSETLTPKENNMSSVISSYRKSNQFPINAGFTDPLEFYLVIRSIFLYGIQYAVDNNTRFVSMQPANMLEYTTESGYYKPHVDDSPRIPRNISSILYLNDVEEGGETYFNKFDVSVSPKAGRMVFFPSNFIYEHEAKQPISNNKYVIVSWFSPDNKD